MNLLMNILWLILGGFWTGVGYIVSSLLLMVTIVGIPFGVQTFKLALLAFNPFGRKVITHPVGGGCLTVVLNLFWIVFGGLVICVSHLVFGLICCVTIIGVPFGLQHFKLAALALAPFGKEVV